MKFSSKEVKSRLNRFSEGCRRSGLKITHQRIDIYRELAGTDENPDAETIYTRVRNRIPVISLDTVYRTFRLFEKKGLISRVGSLNEKTRFDANIDTHHHFICTECGSIKDFYKDEWNHFRVPGDVMTLGKVYSIHVKLRGLCKACQRNHGRDNPVCYPGS